MKKFRLAVLVVSVFLLLLAPAHAIMGVGKCVKSCDGDKECIKECRDQFLTEEESKELYMDEFRDCHSDCDDTTGSARETCLEGCRDDYKLGRDLPRN